MVVGVVCFEVNIGYRLTCKYKLTDPKSLFYYYLGFQSPAQVSSFEYFYINTVNFGKLFGNPPPCTFLQSESPPHGKSKEKLFCIP